MYIYAAILILMSFVAGFVVGFCCGLDEQWRKDRTDDEEGK